MNLQHEIPQSTQPQTAVATSSTTATTTASTLKHMHKRMSMRWASRLTKTLGHLALTAAASTALLLGTSAISAPAQAQTRTAFVHLFEWKWTDVAKECETFLGPKGFAAVQISPPSEHNWVTTGDGAPYPWWMRYQPASYSLDKSRGGTRAQFIDMVNRCNAVGVAVYADAVINHMSGGTNGTTSAGNTWSNKNYPRVPYGSTDFHATCGITDYKNAGNVQNCELSGLQDLDTGKDYVRGKIADYLVDMVNIGVKGFRVDAAKHISPADLGNIIDRVNGRVTNKPYWFLEVIGAPGEAVQPDQYFGLNGNLVNVTEFAYGKELFGKFAGAGKLADLQTFGPSWNLMASNRAVAFTDNHDKQRGHGGGGTYVTYHMGATYDLANVFMLAWPYGYPAIMSSYAFPNSGTDYDTSFGPPYNTADGSTKGPWDGGVTTPACLNQTRGGWVCEHRWRPIANMVGFRNATNATFSMSDWWTNGNNQIAFGRGDKGFVVINKEGTTLSRSFKTSLASGSYCDVISGEFTPASGSVAAKCTGVTVTVDSQGFATISASPYSAAAIHVGAKMGTSVTPPATTVSVTFNEQANTNFGQNIFVVGNIAELGAWAAGSAKPLTYMSGSGTLGNWSATLNLPKSTAIEYKYIKKDSAGNVVWESGANRTFNTGTANSTRNDVWK